MEIRKMTCPKCGGTVKMDGNLTGGVCPSCGMQFGLGNQAPLTVPETQPVVSAPDPGADDYRPGAPAARGRLSFSDEERERVRREAAERSAKEANRAAKEVAQAEKDPAQASLIGERLKAAFRAISAKQWMRADAILNDILKYESDNEDALRGKRLVESHRTELPKDMVAQNPAVLPAIVDADQQTEFSGIVMTPVLVPETETGRRAESEIAETDRRMAARLSDSIDRNRMQKLLNKSNLALSKRNWNKADAYADAALRIDPESAYAYRNKLLAELKLREERLLGEYEGTLANHRFFLLALNYSTGALCRRLLSYVDPATRSALMFERSLAIREMEQSDRANEIADRRVAEITASLPANYNDESAERERNDRISKILDRADAFREQQLWAKADGLYRSALQIDGECADAYLGLLLVSLHLNQEKKLARCKEPFGRDPNFRLAMHYASRVMRRRLERYLALSGQIPATASTNMIILPTQDKAQSTAPLSETDQLRADMNKRLDGIERLILTGGSADLSRLSPEEIAIRLEAAEREVYLIRIALAQLAQDTSFDAIERRSELLSRLRAQEDEVSRLRAALGNADAVGYGNEYRSTELRNTERKLQPFFQRARKLHRRGKYLRADEAYREILKLDPTNGDAYVGRLLCDLHLKNVNQLVKSPRSFSSDEFYALALRFSAPDFASRLTAASEKVDRNFGLQRAKASEKLARSDEKRNEALRGSHRNSLVLDAERRAHSARIAGVHPRPKAEDEALDNAQRYIRRGKFVKAQPILDDLLIKSPDFAGGYQARLLCACSCRKPSKLKNVNFSFSENPDFILACHFGQKKTRRRLEKYAAKVDKRADTVRRADTEWTQIRDVELTGSKAEQEAIYRISGDHAEQRRVRQDAYAVKTAATAAGRKPGQTKPEHAKLLRKGQKYLKHKKWSRAEDCFEQIRNDDAANCSAYIGLLLVSLGLREDHDLARATTTFSGNRYYQLALLCADETTQDRLRDYAARADRRFGGIYDRIPTVNYTVDAARRREDANHRRIDDLEQRTQRLEAELSRRGDYVPVYVTNNTAEEPEDPDDYVHEGGRFGGLKVALFLLGAALVVAAVGAAAYFIMRYTGVIKT